MKSRDRRLQREKQTIRKMARIYCKAHHTTKEGLCLECRALLIYAQERMDSCPYQEGKPACSGCPVHCHEPAMRENIRQIMRYSGPRMLLRHPLLTLLHFLEGIKAKLAPEKRKQTGKPFL